MVPSEDRLAYTRDELVSRLAGMLGGRAADMIVFNEKTTGAQNDIEAATNLARKMVCEWGMSERLGPLALGHKDETVFLGKEIGGQKNYSEDTAVAVDAEIKMLVEGGLERALAVLGERREQLDLLANTLLERESLDGVMMGKLMRGEKLDSPDEPKPESPTAQAAGGEKKPDAIGRPEPLGPPSPTPSPSPAG
jgi:cell division protease FtsH